MAQWKSRPFDPYPGTLAIALRILRSAADDWALHGPNTLPVERVLATVVHTLKFTNLQPIMPLSLQQCLERVGSLDSLLTTRRNHIRPAVLNEEALAELT